MQLPCRLSYDVGERADDGTEQPAARAVLPVELQSFSADQRRTRPGGISGDCGHRIGRTRAILEALAIAR